MASNGSRIQLAVSGPFLLLLLLAAGLMMSGFYLYTHQPPPPKPQSPPYYVNHNLTAVRSCYQCIGADGKLKPSASWRLGKAADIPTGEEWWFTPVEDPPTAYKLDGIPMLPVYPAKDNQKAWEGFDQRRVILIVFQDIEPRFAIDHPAPQAPAAPAEPQSSTPDPAASTTVETQPQQ